MTGKGRCNLTNAQFDDREFVKTLGKNGKFLFSALSVFGPREVIGYFESRGVKTKVEKEGRVFPVSDSAQDVLGVLLKDLRKNKVEIGTGVKVLGFESDSDQINCVKMADGKKIYADNFILATGGKSYPATGSVGAGYAFVKSLGHTILKTAPALTPIKIKEDWAKNLQGLSLENIELTFFSAGKKQAIYSGEILFTHFGISGPLVLNVSKQIGALLKNGEVEIRIDLEPNLSFSELDQKLQNDFRENSNKNFINYLPEILPKKMIETIVDLVGIDPKRKINFVTKEERKNLAKLIKNLELTVSGLLGFDQAMVTSGGVNLKEINPKTMQSKILNNLFFAGEIIDLDGPTGGYNLQICWSTGYVAGTHAGRK
jgi:predicted Rossmann fold flavoprotein